MKTTNAIVRTYKQYTCGAINRQMRGNFQKRVQSILNQLQL